MLRAKFNLACGLRFSRMPNLPMMQTRKLALIAALVAVCLSGEPATGAARQPSAGSTSPVLSGTNKNCLQQNDLNAALGHASVLMQQAHPQSAVEILKPFVSLNCDARVSLLLAAAFEASGDVSAGEQTLQQAHSIWPSNNSIAASLAREYLSTGQVNQAAQALDHFHAAATTPLQEIELAVIVYFSAQQLVSAQTAAEVAYKAYPSVHTLLLLANALQLQGRYPDVNRLLESKRDTYSNSPEFFITLAESENDASIYPAAREDVERAISLNSGLYQAHYILGNVLAKTNEIDKAIAEYRTAISLAPDKPRTYYQLALALRIKQDEAGEELALEQALVVDDHYAPAQCELGRILLEGHRPADAVSHLNAAVQYNPDSEEAYYLLSRAYARLGDKDKSNEMAKRLVAVRKANLLRSESGAKIQHAKHAATP
jgi:tetratricopeptide (TPR) repeat protein